MKLQGEKLKSYLRYSDNMQAFISECFEHATRQQVTLSREKAKQIWNNLQVRPDPENFTFTLKHHGCEGI